MSATGLGRAVASGAENARRRVVVNFILREGISGWNEVIGMLNVKFDWSFEFVGKSTRIEEKVKCSDGFPSTEWFTALIQTTTSYFWHSWTFTERRIATPLEANLVQVLFVHPDSEIYRGTMVAPEADLASTCCASRLSLLESADMHAPRHKNPSSKPSLQSISLVHWIVFCWGWGSTKMMSIIRAMDLAAVTSQRLSRSPPHFLIVNCFQPHASPP